MPQRLVVDDELLRRSLKFGVETLTQAGHAGLFTPHLTEIASMSENRIHIASYPPLVLAGLAAMARQAAAWLAMLGWARRRAGELRLRGKMARPTLLR